MLGRLLKMIMHSGCIGQLAKDRPAQTAGGVSVLTWHYHLALFVPVRQICTSVCGRKEEEVNTNRKFVSVGVSREQVMS